MTPPTLRPWASSDLDIVRAASLDPGIRQWHSPIDPAEWLAAWPRRWAAGTGAGWAIIDDGVVRGQISLRRIHRAEERAEVSYWILPEARGRRLAARALVLLSGWALKWLHRLELNHSTGNPGSCRVAGRAGFPAEGIKRSEAKHPDGWHDMHAHARIAGDPQVTPPAGADRQAVPQPIRRGHR